MKIILMVLFAVPLLCAASSDAPVPTYNCRLVMRGNIDGEPFASYACENNCELLVRGNNSQFQCH
jgi:hypothetical protein